MSTLLRGPHDDAAIGSPSTHQCIPTSLKELQSRLQTLQPKLWLTNPSRPVVLLAQIGEDAWRTLAFDSDVSEIFNRSFELDAQSSVNVEVREIFPRRGAQPVFVKVPLMSDFINANEEDEAEAEAIESPRRKASASFGSGAIDNKAARLHSRIAKRSSPPASPSPPGSPLLKFPIRKVNKPVSVPERARSSRSRNLQMDRLVAPPQTPRYDSRPGQSLDKAWAAMTATAGKTGNVSAHMLEAFGLRDDYEKLQFTSSRSRAALQNILEVRESVPGATAVKRRLSRPSSARVSGSERTLIDATNWERGDFIPVATRDVPELRNLLQSLQAIEGDATVRLNDAPTRVVWRIPDSRKKMAEERTLAHGRTLLLPRKVLVESGWLNFSNIGSIVFRFYPNGDGSTDDEASTIFLWMSSTPGISFSFNIHLGRARLLDKGKYERVGEAFTSAPRLWQASMVHYRMEVSWSEIGATLLNLAENECIEFALQVLQWHMISPPPQENTDEQALVAQQASEH